MGAPDPYPRAVDDFVELMTETENGEAAAVELLSPAGLEALGGTKATATARLVEFRDSGELVGFHAQRSDTGDENGVLSNESVSLFLTSVAGRQVDLRVELASTGENV